MVALDTIQNHLCIPHSPSRTSLSFNDLQEWANDLGSTIHVAVMVDPYLSRICSGEKYIESRMTKMNISPFGRAFADDIVLFKRSGGAITAMASVEHVEFEQLTARGDAWSLTERYSDGLGFEPGYVESKSQARYASLLWLRDVREVPATPLEKRGRQAWVTVRPRNEAEFVTLELSSTLF
jgi:hypothetical protein